MFNFAKLKIGIKIILGILVVEAISLISGVTMGRNITSKWVILGFLATIAISQVIAWLVSENISKSVKDVLGDLSLTSDNLSSVSSELSRTGHKLAEGSSEQAASIQETSSTLEESSSMVHQTTQNTKEAEILAKQTKDAADKGNSEMKTMLESMEELKRSSGEISKIIKVIDEIAFQTNILSLNAAVEAARAGEAGKGFAVVAEEVRNLAKRSAEAAKDTSDIIESNIALSEKCLKITEQVDGSLVSIVQESHKVSELLEEISTASQEQEIGIRQINQAISQMEHVLQANASAAQESAVSVDELLACSDTIKNIMANLSGLIDGKSNAIAAMKAFSAKPKVSVAVTNVPTPKKLPKAGKSALEIKEKRVHNVPTSSVKYDSPKAINPEDIIPLDDF